MPATIDIRGFQAGISGLVEKAKLNSKVVTAKETAEALKTLAAISPKAKPNKIRDSINAKFEKASEQDSTHLLSSNKRTAKSGSGEILWYAFGHDWMRGVGADKDMRKASVEDLKKVLYKITKSGRIRGRHGKQQVLITQKILTKASTVKKLIAAKIKNRGRLAAAWLVAAIRGPLKLSGSNLPPAFVLQHVNSGVRGRYENGLDTPSMPSMTIANFAKGVTNRTTIRLINTALRIRAKAMAANLRMFLSGKKRLADYAK